MLYKQPANWILLDIVIYMHAYICILYVGVIVCMRKSNIINVLSNLNLYKDVFLDRLQTELNSRRERIRGIFLDYLEND